MVTQEIRFFMDNVMNTGNMLGLDRATLNVYLIEGTRSDDEPDVLLHVDSYTVFGGFLEALIVKMLKDAGSEGKVDASWIVNEYAEFVRNIKKYEMEILSHTKRYFEKINNMADALRSVGLRVKIHASELSSGIELYLSGRYEVLREHISRKMNELSAEGVEKIVIVSPFEYALYSKRYLEQSPTFPMKLVFFPDMLSDCLSAKKFNARILIYEPYQAPVSIFRSDIRDVVVDKIGSIEDIMHKMDGVEIVDKKSKGTPIGYEQIWMVNPMVAVEMARGLLEAYMDQVDVIITVRTSTAIILRVAGEFYGLKVPVYDYADLFSRIVLGLEV